MEIMLHRCVYVCVCVCVCSVCVFICIMSSHLLRRLPILFDPRGDDDSVMTDSVLLGFVSSGRWSYGWSFCYIVSKHCVTNRDGSANHHGDQHVLHLSSHTSLCCTEFQ